MVIVIARFRPRPERAEEFAELLREVQAASRADDGCLNYGYYTDVADPLSYVAVEEWRDQAALDAHLRTPHVARLVAAISQLAAAFPDIAVHQVASTGPMILP